jgi:SAM-dependent methyltransferase
MSAVVVASTCPLCGASGSHESWLGSLRYDGREFPYVECESCRSLYADPMPGEETLASMYGPQYEAMVSTGHGIVDPKERGRVVAWLRTQPTGTFLDYGCGVGRLLEDVKASGWRTLGMEFDPRVAAETSARVGVPVIDRFGLDAIEQQPVDVLHLGDVIEHLTDPDADMPRILRLIKPGGYLMAQGPLEAHATLFTGALKIARRLRGTRVSDMAPYHVMLATAAGQQAFFRRFGLEAVTFAMHEVAWPAPGRLDGRDLTDPRAIVLFTLRKVSQALSALDPDRWGNRYFYIGRRV